MAAMFSSPHATRTPATTTTIVALLTFLAGALLTPHALPPATTLTDGLPPGDILAATNAALTNIYAQSVPSVVKVEVERPATAEQAGTGAGSGFVWDAAGHIVTNWHVIRGATAIEVSFSDGTIIPSEVVDTQPLADLAVLRVDRPAETLHPAKLGSSADLRVGELALAIGCPYGQDFTLTRGIISAVGRTIRTCKECYPIPDAIQTDTPINPGSSGGPLLNHRGEVIGINTMMISLSESNTGISFAVSIDTVRQIVPELIATADANR